MVLHLRATGCHLLYGITQCYLPPEASENPAVTQPEAGTQLWFGLSYPKGMVGWVDLGDQLHLEIVYPPTDSHLSQY